MTGPIANIVKAPSVADGWRTRQVQRGEIRRVNISAPHFVTANGLRFAYLEEGEGPLVLMLHGFPDNAESYRQAMHDFATAGFRVVAPYLRGYAPSEIPRSGPFDPLTLAQDLQALITALNPGGRAHLIGMDWGGTSIQAALVHCPELIESAVVMNAAHPATLSKFATDPAQTRSVFHFWFFQMDVAARAIAASDLAMVDYLWRSWSPTYDPGTHLTSVRTTLASPDVMSAALRYYSALYQAAQDRTFPIGDIAVPTLTIYGELDPTATYSNLEEPYFRGPYRRVILDGVGHWPHLERPDEFNRLAMGWFRAHSGSDAAAAL